MLDFLEEQGWTGLDVNEYALDNEWIQEKHTKGFCFCPNMCLDAVLRNLEFHYPHIPESVSEDTIYDDSVFVTPVSQQEFVNDLSQRIRQKFYALQGIPSP